MVRLSPCPSLLLAAALTAQPQVPTPTELAAAQPGMNAILCDRLVQLHNGSPAAACSDLLVMALNHQDTAIAYLLWQESIALAERAGRFDLVLQNHLAMAQEFGLDDLSHLQALLARLAGDEDSGANSTLAATVLRLARQHSVDPEPKQMLTLFDLAVRQALRCGDARFYEYVRDQVDPLRAVALTAEVLSNARPPGAEAARLAAALIEGVEGSWHDQPIRRLRPTLDTEGQAELDAMQPSRPFDELTDEQLLALAEHADLRAVRNGLVRHARNRLLRDLASSPPPETPALCDRLVQVVARLADRDGLDHFTFTEPLAIDRFAIEHGRWRAEQGCLTGLAEGTDNYATARIGFADVRSVVIRGGIRSADGLNFRCKVGQVNLLLNWECQPQNHLWLDGQCHRTSPRALVPGKEHTILLFHCGDRCHVCIDGERMWSVAGSLDGAITVYPALGSEIFVREILVDGRPERRIDGAIGPMM